ncbi:sprT-like domain-containing protein Spartan [Biomphalaria pfeifferi]|uniref:Protein with SprT-like domain at the N terminus n=1 Tax=Biomphalaria pfeifferi TaxID=112525 RepID=A0AAD8EWE7_BIOPF|nr:sprT-like domain-containing protein Spartan [Biomphalaria pfeifferi]
MDDLLYARSLQEQFNRELEFKDFTRKEDHELRSGTRVTRNDVQVSGIDDNDYRNDVSPVDPSLELSDPNPDILTLFLQFNKRFFWGRLSSIEVKWSPRMTSCAGICVYEGRGGLCSVRLSLPLLKLRPRKDLVETLLHEMIHAYLFITDNDRDHDGHGPNFKSHMHRINKATGANISIYHNFHDEVESYQQHWWRCDGPCQNRRPYFGYVKRSMNRAPSPRDFWWAEHQMTCGGKYTKIKEPESYRQKKKEKEDKPKDRSQDIRAFVGYGNTFNNSKGFQNKEFTTTSRTDFHAEKTKTIPDRSDDGTQKALIVNGVLIRKGTSSSSPLPSTSGSLLPVKASVDKIDLTNNSSSMEEDWQEDDSWMLEAETGNNLTDRNKTLAISSPSANFKDSNLKPRNTDDKSMHKVFSQLVSNQNNGVKIKDTQPKKLGQLKINQDTLGFVQTKFAKDFTSVCELINKPSHKKITKKFRFSDSDTDDDLWDQSQSKDPKCQTHIKTSTHVQNSPVIKSGVCATLQSSSHVSDSVPRSSKPENNRSRTNEQISTFDAKGMNSATSSMDGGIGINSSTSSTFGVKGTNSATSSMDGGIGINSSSSTFGVKGTNSATSSNVQLQNSSKQNEDLKFSGQGYRLGSADQGTSYLSLIRKTFNSTSALPSRGGKCSPVASASHPESQEIRKRTLDDAFGDLFPERAKSSKSVPVTQQSDLPRQKQPNGHIETDHRAADKTVVPCPVCNKLVVASVINSHLDECLF